MKIIKQLLLDFKSDSYYTDVYIVEYDGKLYHVQAIKRHSSKYIKIFKSLYSYKYNYIELNIDDIFKLDLNEENIILELKHRIINYIIKKKY